MILTVTPNAAVDMTYRVEDFCLDRVHRPSLAHTVAGGKGVNVSRVYQTLGGKAIATGFLGGPQGRIVARGLAQEGIAEAFVRVRGESRLCIAIVDPNSGTQTEINERGPEISAQAARALARRIAQLLSQHRFDFVVLSGSLPPGAPPTLYAELISLARRAETPAVLDTSGEALREGLCAHPWLVKPNQDELETLFGTPFRSKEERLDAARRLVAEGTAVVLATQGAEGALLVTEAETWEAVPPSITFVNAVASGDSALAAFLWAWVHGERPGDFQSALRLAMGAGAANAAVIGAGFCARDSIFALAEHTETRQAYP